MVAIDGKRLQSGGCSTLVERLWVIDRLRLETSSLVVGGELRTETLWPVLSDADPIFEVSQVGSAEVSRRVRGHQANQYVWKLGLRSDRPQSPDRYFARADRPRPSRGFRRRCQGDSHHLSGACANEHAQQIRVRSRNLRGDRGIRDTYVVEIAKATRGIDDARHVSAHATRPSGVCVAAHICADPPAKCTTANPGSRIGRFDERAA